MARIPTGGKETVISFKADQALSEALAGLPNRSAFIRRALISALDGSCPLCRGTGILSPEQQRHWEEFAKTHRLRHCEICDAYHLVCEEHGALHLPEAHEK